MSIKILVTPPGEKDKIDVTNNMYWFSENGVNSLCGKGPDTHYLIEFFIGGQWIWSNKSGKTKGPLVFGPMPKHVTDVCDGGCHRTGNKKHKHGKK